MMLSEKMTRSLSTRYRQIITLPFATFAVDFVLVTTLITNLDYITYWLALQALSRRGGPCPITSSM